MEERRWDDEFKLTDGPVSTNILEDALNDARNKFVALHKPGSRIEMSDGTSYEVYQDGSWRKVAEATARKEEK